MKYGLLYYKDTDNIGDDIQTYAQKRFLPRIDYLIDREKIGMFIPEKKELVSVIMNGWYLHNKVAWPPSPYINPLLISMHFTTNKRLNGNYFWLNDRGGKYLNENGPIGCRDKESQRLLSQNKIENYFSGCLTLTIKPFDEIKKSNYICLVDVCDQIVDKVKKSTDLPIKIISHNVAPKSYSQKTIEDRMNNVENLLKVYQKAHLVITTRLHAMLPSIALGTPVIYIKEENYEKDRLDTFTKFVDSYIKNDFINMDIKKILSEPKRIDPKFKEIANKLEIECQKFIERKVSKILPPLNEYKILVDDRNYYAALYESCLKQSINNIKEADNYFRLKEERDSIIEKLKNDNSKQISNLNNIIDEQEKRLKNILNSRTYKIALKIRKIFKPILLIKNRYNKK